MSDTLCRFIPSRLTEARQARGLNMSQLAEKVDISRQAVSKYEQGLIVPTDRILRAISSSLDFPIDFFYKPLITNSIAEGTIFYRSLNSSQTAMRNIIRIKCNWTSEIYNFLDQYLTLPTLNLPNLDLMLKPELDDNSIEIIAETVRKFWGIDGKPIDNLVYLLEKNGFIISSSFFDYEKTDACSGFRYGRPVVLLGKGKKSACRIRFSLAHELGHLLLHSSVTYDDLKNAETLNRIEREANRFASAFLLPKEPFISDLQSVSINYLLFLKRKWRTSLSAIVYRCQDLDLISDDSVLMLRKQISYRKWTKNEPLDDEIPLEHPQLLKAAIKTIFECGVVSKSEFVQNFCWSLDDLCDLTNCNAKMFQEEEPIKISLKPIRGNGSV